MRNKKNNQLEQVKLAFVGLNLILEYCNCVSVSDNETSFKETIEINMDLGFYGNRTVNTNNCLLKHLFGKTHLTHCLLFHRNRYI